MSIKNALWIAKYAPTTIEDSVFHTIQEDIPSKTIIMAYKIATDVKIIVFSTI